MRRKHFRLKQRRAAAVRHAASNRRHVPNEGRMKHALRIVGKFGSGQKDFSRDHDRELANGFRS
jgi:hypothetical protein